MPIASKPGNRETPSADRSTSHDPTSTGSDPSTCAATKAWVRFGSQVTHVFFEGCKYYTPMLSEGEEIRWRNPAWIA